MPIYEYRCKQCNRIIEVLQKINSKPLTKCLECGGEVEKIISVSSFQFKGNGWYDTDYKKKQDRHEQHKSSSINNSETKKTEKKKDSITKSSDKRKSENVA